MIGIMTFETQGVSSDKLVLGLPWYGHAFICLNQVNTTVCPLPSIPWRGASCTDECADEINYSDIINYYLPISTSGVQWDYPSQSPWLNYIDPQKTARQIWFDNATSIALKVYWAKDNDLKGVGMYTADMVDPHEREFREFWDAMNAFFK